MGPTRCWSLKWTPEELRVFGTSSLVSFLPSRGSRSFIKFQFRCSEDDELWVIFSKQCNKIKYEKIWNITANSVLIKSQPPAAPRPPSPLSHCPANKPVAAKWTPLSTAWTLRWVWPGSARQVHSRLILKPKPTWLLLQRLPPRSRTN